MKTIKKFSARVLSTLLIFGLGGCASNSSFNWDKPNEEALSKILESLKTEVVKDEVVSTSCVIAQTPREIPTEAEKTRGVCIFDLRDNQIVFRSQDQDPKIEYLSVNLSKVDKVGVVAKKARESFGAGDAFAHGMVFLFTGETPRRDITDLFLVMSDRSVVITMTEARVDRIFSFTKGLGKPTFERNTRLALKLDDESNSGVVALCDDLPVANINCLPNIQIPPANRMPKMTPWTPPYK